MKVISFNNILHETDLNIEHEPDIETELKIEKILLDRDLSYTSNVVSYKKELLAYMENCHSSYKIKLPIKNIYIRKIYLELEFKN